MDKPNPETEQNGGPAEPVLSSETSLGILLIVFLGIFFMALFVIMTGKSLPEGSGREAFRPADFPAVFGAEPVEGLSALTREAALPAATREAGLHHATGEARLGGRAAEPGDGSPLFHVARPPFSEGIFPCSSCHEGMTPDETVRAVGDPHDKIVLRHGNPAERWCLDCHNAADRDVLRLANGKTIPFEESHRLCGQCHGNVYRDWKIGIHGKRVGFWDGPKIYLLCVHCHDPHAPRFKPLAPLPPPVRPDYQREILDAAPPAASPAPKGR